MNYPEVARRLSRVLQQLEREGIILCSKTNFEPWEFEDNSAVYAFETGTARPSSWYPWSMTEWKDLKPWQRRRVIAVLDEMHQHYDGEEALVKDLILSAIKAPGYGDVSVSDVNNSARTYRGDREDDKYKLHEKWSKLCSDVALGDDVAFVQCFYDGNQNKKDFKANLQRRLAEGADPNFVPTDKGKLPPLIISAQRGQDDIVELLLERKANVNISAEQNGQRVTPLSEALKGGHFESVRLLRENGARIYDADAEFKQALQKKDYEFGRIFVQIGCGNGTGSTKYIDQSKYFEEVIRGDERRWGVADLLMMGFDCTTRDSNDDPIIIAAARAKRFDIVDNLIDLGANVQTKDNEGCLLSAVVAQNTDPNSSDAVKEVAKALKKKIDKLNRKDKDAEKQRLSDAQQQMEKKVSLAIKTYNKSLGDEKKKRAQKILCLGIDLQAPKLIAYALDNGADVNQPDPYTGLTPLQMAVALAPNLEIKGKNVVSYLIESGADVEIGQKIVDNGREVKGKTALEIAVEMGDVDTVRSLVAAGAFVRAETWTRLVQEMQKANSADAEKYQKLFCELAQSRNIENASLKGISIPQLSNTSFGAIDNSATVRYERKDNEWVKLEQGKSIHYGHSQQWSLYLAMQMQNDDMILNVLDEAIHTGVDLNNSKLDENTHSICTQDIQNVIRYAIQHKKSNLLQGLKERSISFKSFSFKDVLATNDANIINFVLGTDCVVTKEHVAHIFSMSPTVVHAIFPKLFERNKELFLNATEDEAKKLLAYGISNGDAHIVAKAMEVYRERGYSITSDDLKNVVNVASQNSQYDLVPILNELHTSNHNIFYDIPKDKNGNPDYTQTPLYTLIKNKHVAGVEHFLELTNGNIEKSSRKRKLAINPTYIREAIEQDSPEILKILLQQEGVIVSSEHLTKAIEKGNYKVVELLVRQGVPVEQKDIQQLLDSSHHPETKRHLLGILLSSHKLSDEAKTFVEGEAGKKESKYYEVLTRPYGEYLVTHKPDELGRVENIGKDTRHSFQIPVESSLIQTTRNEVGFSYYWETKFDEKNSSFDPRYRAWSDPAVGGLRVELQTYNGLAQNRTKDNFASFKSHRMKVLTKGIQEIEVQLAKANTDEQKRRLEESRRVLAGQLYCLQQSDSWTDFGRLTGEYRPNSTAFNGEFLTKIPDELYNLASIKDKDRDASYYSRSLGFSAKLLEGELAEYARFYGLKNANECLNHARRNLADIEQVRWTQEADDKYSDARYEMMQSIAWDLAQSSNGRLPEIPSIMDDFEDKIAEGKAAFSEHYRDNNFVFTRDPVLGTGEIIGSDFHRIDWYKNLLFQGYGDQEGIYESVAQARAHIRLLQDTIAAVEASPVWREACAYHASINTDGIGHQFEAGGMRGVLSCLTIKPRMTDKGLFLYQSDVNKGVWDLEDEYPYIMDALDEAEATLEELNRLEQQYQHVSRLIDEYQAARPNIEMQRRTGKQIESAGSSEYYVPIIEGENVSGTRYTKNEDGHFVENSAGDYYKRELPVSEPIPSIPPLEPRDIRTSIIASDFKFVNDISRERCALISNYAHLLVTKKEVRANVYKGIHATVMGIVSIPTFGSGFAASWIIGGIGIGVAAEAGLYGTAVACSDKAQLGDLTDMGLIAEDEGWCDEWITYLANTFNARNLIDIEAQTQREKEVTQILKRELQGQQASFETALEYAEKQDGKDDNLKFVLEAHKIANNPEERAKYEGKDDSRSKLLLKAADSGMYFYYAMLYADANNTVPKADNTNKSNLVVFDGCGADKLIALIDASNERMQAEIEFKCRDEIIRQHRYIVEQKKLNEQEQEDIAQKAEVDQLFITITGGDDRKLRKAVNQYNINFEADCDAEYCKGDNGLKAYVFFDWKTFEIEPLINACLHARFNLSELLKAKITPLMYASLRGNKFMVRGLLERGADANKVTSGLTPLLVGYRRLSYYKSEPKKYANLRTQTDMYETLILKMNEESINHADSEGKTALYYALEHGQLSIALLLIQRGAVTNDKVQELLKDSKFQERLEDLKVQLKDPKIQERLKDPKVQEFLNKPENKQLKEMIDGRIQSQSSCVAILRQSEEQSPVNSDKAPLMAQYGTVYTDEMEVPFSNIQLNNIS